MKVCTKCQVIKPLDGFYNRKDAGDGKTGWCKECIKAKQRAYTKTPQGRETKRRNQKSPKGKAGQKRRYQKYSQTDNGKQHNNEKVRRYQATERGAEVARQVHRRGYKRKPERWKAVAAVNYAVKTGKLPKQDTLPCVHCNRTAQQYHHHKGYEREHWLDVVPVCRKCHTAVHQALRSLVSVVVP